MVFGASCIASLKDGKTVFVPYSLPDEVLEISIVKEHKNYTEGKIEKILEARAAFFAELDRQVPKKNGTDVFDFSKVKEADLKEIYAKFYAFDYNVRKLLPDVYTAFNVNFNV